MGLPDGLLDGAADTVLLGAPDDARTVGDADGFMKSVPKPGEPGCRLVRPAGAVVTAVGLGDGATVGMSLARAFGPIVVGLPDGLLDGDEDTLLLGAPDDARTVGNADGCELGIAVVGDAVGGVLGLALSDSDG